MRKCPWLPSCFFSCSSNQHRTAVFCIVWTYVWPFRLLWNCRIYVPPAPLPGHTGNLWDFAHFIALLCLVSTALAVLRSASSLWFSSCMPALMSLQWRIFQRGQIVPEAAPGTVTTTGQLCQPTRPPPGNQDVHTDAHTLTQTKKHSGREKNDTAGLDNMRRTQRAQADIPLTALWHVEVSLSVFSTSHEALQDN